MDYDDEEIDYEATKTENLPTNWYKVLDLDRCVFVCSYTFGWTVYRPWGSRADEQLPSCECV